MADTIRDKILAFLHEQGGEVHNPDGIYPSKQWPMKASPATISTILRELEDEGVIWSEWIHPRLRGRVALTSHFPKPLDPEEKRVQLAARVHDEVQKVLLEAMEAVSDDAWVAEADRLEQENHDLHAKINDLTNRLRQASEQISDLSQEVRHLNQVVRTVKGNYEAYKRTVKAKVREDHKVKQAAQEFEEVLLEAKADKDFEFTHHAIKRMKEMELGKSQVLRVLAKPDVDYVSSRYGEGARLAQRDDLSVAYNVNTRTVITVLWNKVEQWTREEFVEQRKNGDSEG